MGEEERGFGGEAPKKILQDYALYFGYKCDRRPFWHNSDCRKEMKIWRILCLKEGLHLVTSL